MTIHPRQQSTSHTDNIFRSLDTTASHIHTSLTIRLMT